jgi:hypothetical protein
MGLTGIERDSVTDCDSIDLQQLPESGAAESGAVGPESCQFDSQLQTLIDAWPGLSEVVRTEILNLIHRSG